MLQTEVYLDHSVVVDLLSGRNGYGMSSLVAKKNAGFIFPYSPFHLEEVAAILSTDLEEEKQIEHINQHLSAIRNISNCWEYVPGKENPIQLIQEEPIHSLEERVLRDYWITSECSGVEELHDARRSQRHFEAYLRKIKLKSKGQIRSREVVRHDLKIAPTGVSEMSPQTVFLDARVQNIIREKAANYGLDMEKFPRGTLLRANHNLTQKTVDCLMRVLNEAGFWADKAGKHTSYMFDVGHAIYATRASMFIVGDSRLAKRAQATFSYLSAETQVVDPKTFFMESR